MLVKFLNKTPRSVTVNNKEYPPSDEYHSISCNRLVIEGQSLPCSTKKIYCEIGLKDGDKVILGEDMVGEDDIIKVPKKYENSKAIIVGLDRKNPIYFEVRYLQENTAKLILVDDVYVYIGNNRYYWVVFLLIIILVMFLITIVGIHIRQG